MMRHELLRLMMRFQLCYELPGAVAYIAPQLLSPSQPSYDWQQDENLVLRYEYEFMPKGLITQLIVSLNHLIANDGLVWKAGVILERERTRAEVIEDYPRRRISVRVAGPDTRALLAIIDDQLKRIHRFFPRLKYDRFLPCNCIVCAKRNDPFAYPLSELRHFALSGDAIQCRISRKLVDATALIRDIFPGATNESLWPGIISAQQPSMTIPSAPSQSHVKQAFVSYAWLNSGVVDELEKALGTVRISLVRDKSEVKYKDSIRAFMQSIGRGRAIVVVLSKAYLESKNCMFELTEIAERKDLRDRVFPIVLSDAKIFDAEGRLDYVEFWERKRDQLDARMKAVGGENLGGIREELDLFAKIRSTIAGIVEILGDMNSLSPNQHQDAGFQELIAGLQKRLAD
jgi:internalin A